MNTQTSLFETEKPALYKAVISRSACKKQWITKDGRVVFEPGKEYSHAPTQELSIKGENGIVMWMSKERYTKHFI